MAASNQGLTDLPPFIEEPAETKATAEEAPASLVGGVYRLTTVTGLTALARVLADRGTMLLLETDHPSLGTAWLPYTSVLYLAVVAEDKT